MSACCNLTAASLAPYARRVLTCSSGMIPKGTAEALRARDRGPLWDAITFEFVGEQWLIYVSSDGAAAAEALGHSALAGLLRYADEHSFDWLMLDGDAEYLPLQSGLPRFAW